MPAKLNHYFRHFRVLSISGVAIWFCGCAVLTNTSQTELSFSDPFLQQCLTTYKSFDTQSIEAGVSDAAYHRLDGFPFLRSSRFLASFAEELNGRDEVKREALLAQMNRLAIEGLLLERQQLSPTQLASTELSPTKHAPTQLAPTQAAQTESSDEQLSQAQFSQAQFLLTTSSLSESEKLLRMCGTALVEATARKNNLWGDIQKKSQVPDHYQAWKRWLGLYPILALPFRHGVVKEHQRIHQQSQTFLKRGFEAKEENLYQPKRDKLISQEHALRSGKMVSATDETNQNELTPLLASWSKQVLTAASKDALGIPQLDSTTQQQLLLAWAPSWSIEAGGENDQVGRVRQPQPQKVFIDSRDPSFYNFVSFGRYNNEITIQLNYSVWFSERKPNSHFDLVSGLLDGVTWRVHLTVGGDLIAADTVHNCGCWYQLYLGPGYQVQASDVGTLANLLSEPTFVAEQPLKITQAPWRLSLAANTHFLLGLTADKTADKQEPQAKFIRQLPYNALRALPQTQGGFQSLFAENGLVDISKRPERWLFWPMGVASPGAMRIAGTHAIAFIGRRHFDEPGLLYRLGVRETR